MKTLKIMALMVAAMILLGAAEALAASTSANLTIGATVSNTGKLTISPSTISFPDADPDTVGFIAPSEGPVTVDAKAKTSGGGGITLDVLANGDLTTGSDIIAISNIAWTSGSPDYNGTGTMNKTTAQPVGSWSNSGWHQGVLNFRLANSWSYAVGSYSASATFTLTYP